MTFQVIGHGKTLTFIHIPKTGGTSITKWFNTIAMYPPNKYHMIRFCETREHWGLNEVKEVVKNTGHVFAVVRNPWDYMVSLYIHLTTHWMTEKISFKNFVERLPEFSGPLHKNYHLNSQQSSWINDDVEVLRFETLNKDFKKIQELMNFYIPLGHYNASIRNAYAQYYDDSLKKMVAQYFEEDIERFKYVFIDEKSQ